MSDKDFKEFLEDIENLTDSKILENKVSTAPVEGKKDKKRKLVFKEVDLHGYDVLSAQRKVVDYTKQFFDKNPTIHILHLRIITGKGRHSSGGRGKLIEEVYHFVKTHFKHSLLHIDEPPAELKINSVPIKGHFEIKLAR